MSINVIITGVTGMVGEGILHECIQHPAIDKILVLTRRPGGFSGPNVIELIHDNFNDISSIESQLTGYQACFFCSGVSSINKREDEYYALTYTLTLAFAERLASVNPDMAFCYVSGAGTDSTEQGNSMWARIKGKTENDLMKLPFSAVYNFRPGYLQPIAGLKNANRFYSFVGFLYPLFKATMPKRVSTLSELGRAMINAVLKRSTKPILEVTDIVRLAKE